MQPKLPFIISAQTLFESRNTNDLLIVDLRDKSSYDEGHIPGAVWLDYQSLLGKRPPVLGDLPSDQQLSQVLRKIGLDDTKHVIAYDEDAGAAAARLLWTLDVVGHDQFSLLDGGFSSWAENDYPETEEHSIATHSQFIVPENKRGFATRQYVMDALQNPNVVLFDTRTPEEFIGTNIRAARGGHIPGAVNLNWLDVTDKFHYHRLLDLDTIRAMYSERGVDPDKEIIPYCHSHHRSSHTYVVLKHLGYKNVNAYAGSWSEWGNLEDVPIELEHKGEK